MSGSADAHNCRMIGHLNHGSGVARGGTGLTMTVAGRLRAAERQVDFGADGRRVDVDDAGVHVTHGGERAVDVLSVYRSGEAVLHAVAYGDSLVEGPARNHRHDG